MVRRVLALLCLMLLGCTAAPPPSAKSQSLNLYSFAAYFPPALLEDFTRATGIKVTLETYESNEALLSGLAARPGHYDLIIPSDYAVEELIASRKLLPLDLAQVRNWNNIEVRFLSPYFDPGGASRGRRPSTEGNAKYSLPFLWGTTGIAYHQKLVQPAPTRWADLWRPELAGKLVVLDDAREMLGLTLLSLGYDKNETNPDRLEEARVKLATLMKGVATVDSSEPEAALISGKAVAGVIYNGNAVLAARQNPDIAYAFPAEGAGIWFDNLAIPRDAPHPDASYTFMSWILQPEQSAMLMKAFPYSSPNREGLRWLETHDASAFAALQADPATNPPPEALAGARLVKRLTPELTARYDQIWSSLLAARKETP